MVVYKFLEIGGPKQYVYDTSDFPRDPPLPWKFDLRLYSKDDNGHLDFYSIQLLTLNSYRYVYVPYTSIDKVITYNLQDAPIVILSIPCKDYPELANYVLDKIKEEKGIEIEGKFNKVFQIVQ